MKDILKELDELDDDFFDDEILEEVDDTKFDVLKLENQICFPMYAASRSVMSQYKQYLDGLSLTYTQYLVMLVMWQYQKLNVSQIGNLLFLDSGTLTPVLKALETKKYVKRKRSKEDERNIIVTITEKGELIRERAVYIPEQILQSRNLNKKEVSQLKELLYKFLGGRTVEESKENK